MDELRRTPLHAAHKALGGRLVPFGGWELPVMYTTSVVDEHRCVRERVGLFDVSHMGQVVFRGPQAVGAVRRLMTNATERLTDGAAMYTTMCLPSGGIVDDCIVYRRSASDILVIVNASNTAKDFAWMREHAGATCDVANESDAFGLIAVQGPRAAALVARVAGAPLDQSVASFHFTTATIAGAQVMAARTGYTGEDGFELMVPAERTAAVWELLLAEGAADGVMPIGLGARDTLRLEARLSLYGNDLDETTTPLEAGLGWVVKLDGPDFLGKAALVAEKAAGSTRKLVGFKATSRGIPRHDYPIHPAGWAGGAEPAALGKVTSGTTGPTVGVSIGLGYVPAAHAAPGTELTIDCRGKPCTVSVVAGPFYKRSK